MDLMDLLTNQLKNPDILDQHKDDACFRCSCPLLK